MRMKKILSIWPLVAAVLLSYCSRNELDAPVDETLSVTIGTQTPSAKATFEGTDLVWSGDENAAVLVGNASGYISSKLTSSPKYPGSFSGAVSLGSYGSAGIKAVAIPAEGASLTEGHLAIDIPAAQTQAAPGVLAWAPLWRELSFSDLTAKDNGTYAVEGLALKWGASVIRLNIYGKQAAQNSTERLLSVSLKTEG